MAKNNKVPDRIQAVWNILGGDEGVDRLLSGKTVIKMAELPNFPTWKTITLGTGLKTATDFRKAIKANGCYIGDWGNDILSKSAFTACDTEMEVDLVNVSVAELGFKDGAIFKDICDRAIELGLELCPAEVGPQLRLQDVSPPTNVCFIIAMEPIMASSGTLFVFFVVFNNSGRCLNSHGIDHPDDFWDDSYRFVFLRSK